MTSKEKSQTLFKSVPESTLLEIYKLMVKSRVLEERLIQTYKQGQALFWIGGPGEEAFGVPLGMLAKKGEGIGYDWLHLHYRATPTLVAMGLPMKDAIRLAMNKATDTQTGGRQFSNHYAIKKWNVVPISSTIGTQYSTVLGTARVQMQNKTNSISIVTGGDAGTAEGDFASCLVWASRPQEPLPILITVQNNGWGISTDYLTQHGEKYISDRGKAFGIKCLCINGLDPVESYLTLKKQMADIRKTRKPVLIEARVSRLYGHSSATGASRNPKEICPIKPYERRLIMAGLLTEKETTSTWELYKEEALASQQSIRKEGAPGEDSIWKHIWAQNEDADWRQF